MVIFVTFLISIPTIVITPPGYWRLRRVDHDFEGGAGTDLGFSYEGGAICLCNSSSIHAPGLKHTISTGSA
jgi:hypothetical protein